VISPGHTEKVTKCQSYGETFRQGRGVYITIIESICYTKKCPLFPLLENVLIIYARMPNWQGC